MKIINKVTDESYIQWIEKFVEKVTKRANIQCQEITVEDVEHSKRIFLTIDGEEYIIRTWNFHPVKKDEDGKTCAEMVGYTLYKMVMDNNGSHGETVDEGKIKIEWKAKEDKHMKGTIKWFNANKGYGFVTRDSDGTDYFFHHSNIIMNGFRALDTNDIVDFEIGADKNSRVQAINVTPILTMKMVEDALKKENLFLQISVDDCGGCFYRVVDENDIPKTDENGISLIEVAAYAGIDTEDLFEKKEKQKLPKDFKEKYVETVHAVTRKSRNYILSRYDEACENLKNLSESEKEMLVSCNIKVDDMSDLPSVLTSIKEQWDSFSDLHKAFITRTIAGVRGTLTLDAYMNA